jgi:hypothetical protein
MDTEGKEGRTDMDRCKHDLFTTECWDCSHPVTKKAEPAPAPNAWTAEEDEFLLEARGDLKISEIAEAIGRTPKAVEDRIRFLADPEAARISSQKAYAKAQESTLNDATYRGEAYTADEDDIILNGEGTLLEKATRLGRTLAGVATRRQKLRELNA